MYVSADRTERAHLFVKATCRHVKGTVGSWMSGIRWEETELVALRLSPPPSQVKTQLSTVGTGSPPSAGGRVRFVRIEGNFLAYDICLEGGSASG